jgi:hypothetical protein
MDIRSVSAKTISFPLKNNGSVSERSYSNMRKDYSPSGKRIDKNASQFSLSHEPQNLRQVQNKNKGPTGSQTHRVLLNE